MFTERTVKVTICILILIAAAPIAPVYFYVLEAGMDANLATIIYVAGLLAGTMLVLFYSELIRRSNRNRVEEGHNRVNLASSRIAGPSKRATIALVLIAIILFLIYPIRFYAPGEKALFAPLVYWVGVTLGTSLVWIAVRPESTRITNKQLPKR